MRKAAFAEGRSDVDTAPRDKDARYAHERKRRQQDGQSGATGRPYGTGLACGIQRTNGSGDRKTDNPARRGDAPGRTSGKQTQNNLHKKIPRQGSNGRAYQAHTGHAALSAATRPPSVQGREPERDEGGFCRGMRLQEIYRQDVFHAHDASVLHAGRPFGSA